MYMSWYFQHIAWPAAISAGCHAIRLHAFAWTLCMLRISPLCLQGGGRLLTKGDIGPNLCNQLMELFWPDDNCWYLVEIRSIDSKQIKAAITYVTGETEELDLEEIIREGHMQTIVRRT